MAVSNMVKGAKKTILGQGWLKNGYDSYGQKS